MAAEPPTPETGRSPFDINWGANIASDSWLMPPKTTGVAIGVICWPISEIKGEPSEAAILKVAPGEAGFGEAGFHSVEANCANEIWRGSRSVWASPADPFSKMSI